MTNGMDDVFNRLGGSGQSHYTVEEIEKAKKRQKKHGGTIIENLEAVTGKTQSAPANPFSLDGYRDNLDKAQEALSSLQKATTYTAKEISSDIRELNANLEKDDLFKKPEPRTVLSDTEKILEAFRGLTDTLKESIYGQEEFLKKLVIAFKRPFVSQRDHNDALNSIYIYGPSATGKHYALSAMATELCKRSIIKTPEIKNIDLSLYPGASEEKLFLQDLYAALQSSASILVFEHMEACHISMLTRLSDLVTTGECKLSERYIMQNGQLVNVANALAGNTIGSFEAKGKYLVFLSTAPVEKLADLMGTPFINALGDLCPTKPLEEESLHKISLKKEEELISQCKSQLFYHLTIDHSFRENILSKASKGKGLDGILKEYQNILRALTELRLERDDLPCELTLSCKEGDGVILAGDEQIPLREILPAGYNGELEKVKEELNSIIGLKEVKDYIYSLEEYFNVQRRRREAGLKAGEVNKHMIFTGNPGTGKTTIARIVSKYLKAIGVLSGGQLVEVSRGDLVGRYVGHTAPLVNQVIKSAIGGVLFIDEAYSLHRGGEDNFGLEAIDALVKGIEDNRDDLIVILAGYSNEMETFLESNSGLKSRFPNIIDFPDYTGQELLDIGKLTAKSKGYVIDPGAEDSLLSYFNQVQATRAFDAGNGRLVRNKLEEAILNQSRRLIAEPEAELSTLIATDFELNDL